MRGVQKSERERGGIGKGVGKEKERERERDAQEGYQPLSSRRLNKSRYYRFTKKMTVSLVIANKLVHC